MELRDYQQDLIDKARDAMRRGRRRVLIVAPCGAGKTVLAAFMARECTQRGGRVLFLAHRRELLEQSRATFERAGIPLDNVDIMSIQCAVRRVGKLPQYKMVICDECHHAAAATYRAVLGPMRDAFIIGLTATPTRIDGHGLDDVFEEMVSGIGTAELVQRGFLTPYRAFIHLMIDCNRLKVRAGEYTAESMDAELERSDIYGKAVTLYRDHIDGKQAIIYCATINHSKKVCAEFKRNGIMAAHLDANTPAKERGELIEQFRTGAIKVLTNVDLFGEGFDVPACDAVILQRPTKSLALYIQQSMRAMRVAQGKEVAYIFDCVDNIRRHNLPDMKRNWTLAGKPKRDKSQNEIGNAELGLHTCPECHYVFADDVDICPICGAEIARERSELTEHDVDLHEITPEERERMLHEERNKSLLESIVAKRARRREEADCHSYEELIDLARMRGYNVGWAYHRAKARGYI